MSVECPRFLIIDSCSSQAHKEGSQLELNIGYTSFGVFSRMGFDNFVALAKSMYNLHRDWNIKFHMFGISPTSWRSPNMIFHDELDTSVIDIIISCDNKMVKESVPSQHDLTYRDFDRGESIRYIISQYTGRSLVNPNNRNEGIKRIIENEIVVNKILKILNLIPTDFIGGCPIDKALIMGKAVIDHQLRNCVEIGVWRGRSLVPLAVATKYTNGSAYGIDPYTPHNMMECDAPDHVMQALPQVIDQINFEDVYNSVRNLFIPEYPNCSIIRTPAIDAISQIDFPIDLLHIDGNHDRDLVTTDIRLYVPKVRLGGWIIMDDINWESVISTLQLLEQYADKISDYGTWGVWIRTK